jgi:AraC family transcriptional regulator
MLLLEFPDIQWLKNQIASRFANRRGWGGVPLSTDGWPTVRLRIKTSHAARHDVKGPLSIFTNLSGTSTVQAGSVRTAVHPDVFFVSNADQHYSLEINQPTETFNIHIGEKLSEEVFYQLRYNHNHLLDNPEMTATQTPVFHNKLHWSNPTMRMLIAQLKESCYRWEEEELLGVMVEHLLREQQHLNDSKERINATRKSTREEIVKRLLLATDYLYAYYDQEISLDQLARISCLSKFHFIRLFKEFFQQSPHQFLLDVRLTKAVELLKGGQWEVKTLATRTGFKDASSFSRLFRNRVGVYPTQYSGIGVGV